ncbi:hypothetical protein BY996DRAFT_6416057 [Phakopsora pachyrhizi]|nr:hypothetical protein BY996DRAFT_6416057 [Phakopsora pachyrhizi]
MVHLIPFFALVLAGGGGGGFNFGGLGLPMAFSPFGGLINQIGACRSSLVSGISAQVAFSQVSRIASMFQQAIGSLQGCGTCGLVGPGLRFWRRYPTNYRRYNIVSRETSGYLPFYVARDPNFRFPTTWWFSPRTV